MTGFYSPERHTTNLAFRYPLPGSQGTVEAAARCNILNGQLLCGVHNRHNTRTRYHHLVSGSQTVESKKEMSARAKALHEALEKATQQLAVPIEEEEPKTETPPTAEDAPTQQDDTEQAPEKRE